MWRQRWFEQCWWTVFIFWEGQVNGFIIWVTEQDQTWGLKRDMFTFSLSVCFCMWGCGGVRAVNHGPTTSCSFSWYWKLLDYENDHVFQLCACLHISWWQIAYGLQPFNVWSMHILWSTMPFATASITVVVAIKWNWKTFVCHICSYHH